MEPGGSRVPRASPAFRKVTNTSSAPVPAGDVVSPADATGNSAVQRTPSSVDWLNFGEPVARFRHPTIHRPIDVRVIRYCGSPPIEASSPERTFVTLQVAP